MENAQQTQGESQGNEERKQLAVRCRRCFWCFRLGERRLNVCEGKGKCVIYKRTLRHN